MSIRPGCSFDNIYSPMHLSDVRPTLITANENQKQKKVSDVAEEVSPQSLAQNRHAELWNGQTVETHKDRLMEAGCRCGLAKSNRNCDQTLEAWRENGFRLKWNFKRLTDS